jgi:hypothetical protein
VGAKHAGTCASGAVLFIHWGALDYFFFFFFLFFFLFHGRISLKKKQIKNKRHWKTDE